MAFVHQFGGAYVSTEGALWRTLWRLLLPGQLTLEYFAGRRRHFVLPVRLYLTVSVVALIVLRLGSAAQLQMNPDKMPNIDFEKTADATLLDLAGYRVGAKGGKVFCEGFSPATCERFRRRIDPKMIAVELQEAPARFFSHLGSAMFLLVPAFALWLKLVYLDKRRYYTEHLVFALHLHTFWFLMLMVYLTPTRWVALPALMALMLYPLAALHRVYGTRWWSTAIRAPLLFVLHLVTVVMVLMSVFVWTLLS